MQITIDSHPIEAHAGERLVDLVRKLGLDTDSLKTRPLAADIAGEVFTLNYMPLRGVGDDNAPTTVRMRKAISHSNGKVKLIRYDEARGRAVYERTLLFVFFLKKKR